MKRSEADSDLCVGSGQCVPTEPAVFDQDDDGIVALLTDHPDDQSAAQARHAVALCPSRALSIPQESSGYVVRSAPAVPRPPPTPTRPALPLPGVDRL
ncbi:ferredoxin [Nonomuraea diastatica]|uniref:Divergent 4Fe-4S mono-cluster domain-containing protein n=1 Tax=Nonomuraea diastatica TaxID=1848329 RepID=A0A4R4WUF2_9ACTN|nr:(4Fe-4S)-binding protein [Nonomuraea diastatica]TDD21252.1 hypothetical protein E1294_15530 [Nonomuraea diastatica]